MGQHTRSYEKDFSPEHAELTETQLILFCYPVYTFYTFIASYPLHRLMELIEMEKELTRSANCYGVEV